MKQINSIELPSKFYLLDTEAMAEICGGVNLGMFPGYLDKTKATEKAKEVIRNYGWTNVTVDQLAKEIYGHAAIYYKAAFLSKIWGLNEGVYQHAANGVDVVNGVDRFQPVWELIWALS